MATVLDLWSRELANKWSEYVANATERWDHIYARGFGEMLDGATQRARHYVVAGLVADVCGHAPRVLDVGCGFGTTYRLLRRLAPVYTGIDLSSRAVQRCRDRFGDDPFCTFEVAAFERYEPRGTFDAIILSEVLQYFPLRKARAVIDKAVAHLSGPRGVLVIALSNPLKAPLLWAACRAALPDPLQRISVNTRAIPLTGDRWTVKAYTCLKDEIDEEPLEPPISGVDGPTLRWREKVS
ncbi:MAG: class I SAM-dependent methyltransferase [Minicystis sp.]